MRKYRIVILFLILLIAAGCALADDAARIGSDVYLPIGAKDGQILLRVPVEGEGGVCVTRADSFTDFIPYREGFICLATENGGSTILYVHGSTAETLYPFGAERAENLMLVDGQPVVRMDHLLYSVDPATGVKLKLSSAQMDECVIEGNTAYYIAAADRIPYKKDGAAIEAGCIYRLNLSTAGTELLLKNGADSLRVQNGTLYFHSLADAYVRDGALHGNIYSLETAHLTLAPVCSRADDGMWMLKAGLVARHGDALCLHPADGERTICEVPTDAEIRSDGERLYIWSPANGTLTQTDAQGTQAVLCAEYDLRQSPDAPRPTLEPTPEPAADSVVSVQWRDTRTDDAKADSETKSAQPGAASKSAGSPGYYGDDYEEHQK